jgi:hypothetical protein
MPAKDRLHDVVVHALIKDGWTIVNEQYHLPISKKHHLWIDIHAARNTEQLAVLIEVKGFLHISSQLDYLASVVGQYVLYETMLEYLQIPMPLYLAVPEKAYNEILSEVVGQQVVQKLRMCLILFEPDKEEIVRWMPQP